MSVRKAVRTMTGTPYRKAPEIVLGNVEWGDPQVTIKFGYDTYVSVSDPMIIEQMIEDLREAALHLHGKVIS